MYYTPNGFFAMDKDMFKQLPKEEQRRIKMHNRIARINLEQAKQEWDAMRVIHNSMEPYNYTLEEIQRMHPFLQRRITAHNKMVASFSIVYYSE